MVILSILAERNGPWAGRAFLNSKFISSQQLPTLLTQKMVGGCIGDLRSDLNQLANIFAWNCIRSCGEEYKDE